MNCHRFLLTVFLVFVSYLFFCCCQPESDISTWAPEVDLSQITGSRCCYLGSEYNVNRGLLPSKRDHPDCGRFPINEDTGRIFQGRDAYEGQFPWFVLFFKSENNNEAISTRSYCGGVILDRFHVLTAAHCVYEKLGQYISMSFGAIDLRDGGDIEEFSTPVHLREWTTVFFHKNHRVLDISIKVHIIDLAVIRIPKGITWLLDMQEKYKGESVNYICWRSADLYQFDECQNVTVAGFGLVYGNRTYPTNNPVLQTRRLRICSRDHCQSQVTPEYLKVITDEFCSARLKRPRSRTCIGDSGSPIISYTQTPSINPKIARKRAFLVGIHARDSGNCHTTVNIFGNLVAGRHTKIGEHLKWIAGVVDDDPIYTIEPTGWIEYFFGTWVSRLVSG